MGYPSYGGACGWLFKNDEGEEELYVSALPKRAYDSKMHFENAPKEMDGKDITTLVKEHLEKLSILVKDAKKQFPPTSI